MAVNLPNWLSAVSSSVYVRLTALTEEDKDASGDSRFYMVHYAVSPTDRYLVIAEGVEREHVSSKRNEYRRHARGLQSIARNDRNVSFGRVNLFQLQINVK
jgi:hypothetical protein